MREDQPAKRTLIGREITRSFDEGGKRKVVLNGVSLEFHPSEITLLMGPSGSGKTTLLACLSGLLRPDTGEVIALGQDLWAMSDLQRERFRLKHCGFIFQGFNLFSSLTARQQIEMVVRWGEGASSREARRRTDEMLDLLGLTRVANQRPSALSGGEKQRVAIGRALIKGPELCFADEPTSALDWGHGKHVVELLRNAAHDNDATVVVVSHDPRLIPLVDRVYHMEDGRLTDREEPHGTHAETNGTASSASEYPAIH
jgi:putative ABC transport system ATP-binding protein